MTTTEATGAGAATITGGRTGAGAAGKLTTDPTEGHGSRTQCEQWRWAWLQPSTSRKPKRLVPSHLRSMSGFMKVLTFRRVDNLGMLDLPARPAKLAKPRAL